jgi:hypothetical protein
MLLVGLLGVASIAFATADDDADSCQMKTETTLFDLKSLKRPATNPIRFYDGSDLYKINFCGAGACLTPGVATPGCKQSVSSQLGVDETAIGSYYGLEKADINMNDIVDINFKTKQNPMFATDMKGIKIYYAPPGQQGSMAGQAGQQAASGGTSQFGQQSAVTGGSQFGQTQPPQQGVGTGTGQSGWPAGRRLLQWPNQGAQQQPGMQQQQQQQQQQQPAAQQVKQDSSPLTVFILCNPAYTSNANPVVFAPSMNYRTRTNGYMFVMESAAGCPVEENFIERAAGGLSYGWVFIICFSVLMVLYCGIGMFYKIKKLGVTGIEAIPNIEFWRDYPTIVKDGCSYSLATLNSCFSKGSGGSYSPVN